MMPLRKSPNSVSAPTRGPSVRAALAAPALPASERAHVLMEDVFGNQNGNAQRADEIAQHEAGEISNCHLDTTFFFNSFYTIAHPAQKCNASGSYFYGACAL